MDSIHHIHGEFVGKGNEENYNIQEDIRAQLEKGIFCLEPEFSKVYFQSIFPNFVQPKVHFWPNSEFKILPTSFDYVSERKSSPGDRVTKNKYFPHSKRYSRKKTLRIKHVNRDSGEFASNSMDCLDSF